MSIEIPGFFDYQTYYDKIVDALPEVSRAIEIGVFYGASAHYFLTKCREKGKTTTLHLVDHFQNSSIYETLVYLREFRDDIVIHPKSSALAASDFHDNSVDFVWLDGDHSFLGCSTDIKLYLPKVKVGGTIGGHDFNHHKFQVRQAVEASLGSNYTKFKKHIWEHVKQS